MKRLSQCMVVLGLTCLGAAAGAQPSQAPWGPGMMYGRGAPGPVLAPDGHFYGMGPGMMQGWGGPYGGGPGMMYGWGGYGMGPGMMGGWGYPGGMMRGLDLNEQQAKQIQSIADAARKRALELSGAEHEARVALRNAMSIPRDRAAARAAYQKLSQLQAQRMEIGLDAADQVDAVLTPQQRETLRARLNQWRGIED